MDGAGGLFAKELTPSVAEQTSRWPLVVDGLSEVRGTTVGWAWHGDCSGCE